jgi:arginyl-tRNA synthetase
MLAKFPETIEQSAKDYAPALITRYLLTLSAQRNSYYHHTKILDDELSNDVREFRLQLVMGIAEILKQ